MSKRYEREEKELNRLERELREQKALNKSLLKKLKSLSKGYYKFMYADTHALEEEAVREAKKIAKKVCWDCHVGEMIRIDVGNRYFYKCSGCDKTTHSKPIKE